MKRKFYLLLAGGSSYSPGSVDDPRDLREVGTIRDAKRAARAFWRGSGWGDGATPCADDVSFHFFRADPRGSRDPYPDEVWTRGEDGEPVRERV